MTGISHASGRQLLTRGGRVIEREHRPECAHEPIGRRVTFGGGRRGTHEGDGWIRVYGEGEHYDFVGRSA